MDVASWVPRSFRMWLSAMLDTANQYLEVIVIGFFLGPAVAAFYFVATRITNVFSMIAASMTGYATSRISALYHTGARDELQQTLALARRSSAHCSPPAPFVAIVFGGKLLLWSFGAVYVASYPALLVLAARRRLQRAHWAGRLSAPADRQRRRLSAHHGGGPVRALRADRSAGAALRADGSGGRLEHLGRRIVARARDRLLSPRAASTPRSPALSGACCGPAFGQPPACHSARA